jgi:hypothetical protein
MASLAPAGVSFVETGQQLNPLVGRGVALGDFNGDETLDAFVTNADSDSGRGYRAYFNNGQGQFTDSGQVLANPSNENGKPVISDINRDGKLDVITGKTVWLNDGHGGFTAHPELIGIPENAELSTVELSDLDGDGNPDILAAYNDSGDWGGRSLRVYRNDGQGHFRDTGQRFGYGMIYPIVLGDVNGDGFIDAVTAGWRENTITPGGSNDCPNRVWLNDGKGNFRDSGQVLDLGMDRVHGAALSDLNGDGRLELVLALNISGSVKIYLNDGQGGFRDSGQFIQQVSSVQGLALGDLNGDGSPDLFINRGDPPDEGNPNVVWLNDGQGNFYDSGLRLGQAVHWSVALGDLNADGKLDAFVVGFIVKDQTVRGVPAEIWLNTTP